MKFKTNEDIKKEAVKFLEDLIKDIESNKTHLNYKYGWDVLDQVSYPDRRERDVRFFIDRTEIEICI